jgi:hypothetical protein
MFDMSSWDIPDMLFAGVDGLLDGVLVGAGVCPHATLQITIATKSSNEWRMIPPTISHDRNTVGAEMFREWRRFYDWLQK